MITLIYIFIFCLGCIIGSFLNVVIYRFNSGKTLGGRSMCMTCSKTLSWYELIPVISFLFQKGKCNTCATKISHQYPIVEFITGAVFTAVAYHFSPLLSYAFNQYVLLVTLYTMMFSLLIVISVYDMRHKIIPDMLVFVFGIFAFSSMFINQGIGSSMFIQPTFLSLISGVVYALPFALISLVSRQRLMGFGDSKMILGIGWMLGLMQGGAAIMLAFWIGTLASLAVMFIGRHKVSMNTEVPFGPFLAISAFLVFIFNINIFDLASVFTF